VPRLSVVIPTLARHATLARALERLAGHGPEDVEVIVAADALEPDPEAVEGMVGNLVARRRVVRAPRPGAAAARNAGWRAAQTPLVLFLDDDVLVADRLLEHHLACHAENPEEEVACLGHVRWAAELKVTPFMRWLERGVQFHFSSIAGEWAGWAHFYTANVSLKRALLERSGGFDEEAFPFHYEDLDLGRRLADLGLRLRYDRDAVGEHLHVQTLKRYAGRVAAIAPAERRFVARYPDVRPYFHDLFSEAAAIPAGRGWGARLAPWVPPRVPLVGPAVRWRAELSYRQALAPAFLDAWARAGADQEPPSPERAASSAGSEPGGPK